MNEMHDLMESRLRSARQGYQAFRRFQKNYPADRYVLFRDERLFRAAVDYFDDYARTFPAGTAFALLFPSEEQRQYAGSKIRTKARCLTVDENMQRDLLAAYALCDLSRWLTVASLTEPYDTGAWRLLGKKNVGAAELVCFDIYGMDAVPVNTRLAGDEESP